MHAVVQAMSNAKFRSQCMEAVVVVFFLASSSGLRTALYRSMVLLLVHELEPH